MYRSLCLPGRYNKEGDTLRMTQRFKQLLLIMTICSMLFCFTGCRKKDDQKVSYAMEGVVVVEDPDALQQKVDEMEAQAAEGGISLEYKNDAFSNDGTNFSCYIANAANNIYDMFIAIYADAELNDQLFLSDLLRPGTAFNTLALEQTLDAGVHTVYVAFTQVEEDWETIHGQVIVTMNFTVEK